MFLMRLELERSTVPALRRVKREAQLDRPRELDRQCEGADQLVAEAFADPFGEVFERPERLKSCFGFGGDFFPLTCKDFGVDVGLHHELM